jgi:hypothetical protein
MLLRDLVFTAVKIEFVVLWDPEPCSGVNGYQLSENPAAFFFRVKI